MIHERAASVERAQPSTPAGLPDWSPYAPPHRATLELAERPRVLDAPQDAERRWRDPFIA